MIKEFQKSTESSLQGTRSVISKLLVQQSTHEDHLKTKINGVKLHRSITDKNQTTEFWILLRI